MGLQSRPLAIQAHAWFFRAGDTTANPSGTASSSAIPLATEANWQDFGYIEDWDISAEDVSDQKVYNGQPGRLQLVDIIRTRQNLKIKITCGSMSALALEALLLPLATQNLSSTSYQFNPNAGVPRKGWLKIQEYGHDDALILSMDLWVRLAHDTSMKGGGENLVKPVFIGELLYNPLNTAAIGTQAGQQN